MSCVQKEGSKIATTLGDDLSLSKLRFPQCN